MNDGYIFVGKGRLCGANVIDGETVVILKQRGTLYEKRVFSTRAVDKGIFGYAEDGADFEEGKLTYGAEVRFEKR